MARKHYAIVEHTKSINESCTFPYQKKDDMDNTYKFKPLKRSSERNLLSPLSSNGKDHGGPTSNIQHSIKQLWLSCYDSYDWHT